MEILSFIFRPLGLPIFLCISLSIQLYLYLFNFTFTYLSLISNFFSYDIFMISKIIFNHFAGLFMNTIYVKPDSRTKILKK